MKINLAKLEDSLYHRYACKAYETYEGNLVISLDNIMVSTILIQPLGEGDKWGFIYYTHSTKEDIIEGSRKEWVEIHTAKTQFELETHFDMVFDRIYGEIKKRHKEAKENLEEWNAINPNSVMMGQPCYRFPIRRKNLQRGFTIEGKVYN